MKQKTSERISAAIHDYRDGETLLFLEEPFESADISKTINKKHIGIRITFAVTKRSAKLSYSLGKVLKELDTVAFDDEKHIDYIEVLRVKADSLEECGIAVELVEISEKRSLWLNE
jgi:hypothetical protein